MATFLDKITKVRGEMGDRPRRTIETFDGDGTKTVFETSERPIRANSFTVKVGSTTQTEGSSNDFTIDLDLGLITFTAGSIPTTGTDNVEVQYQYVKRTEAEYLELYNDALMYFKDRFWLEEYDETSLSTVKDQFQYDVGTIDADVFWVVGLQLESAAGKADWAAATNWKYLPQLNKIEVNPTFSVGSLALRFHVLKRYALGTGTGNTYPVQDRYSLPFEYYVKHRLYERMIAEKIDQVGAITTNATFVPGPAVVNVAQYYLDLANDTAKKIAPKMPPQAIRQVTGGKII